VRLAASSSIKACPEFPAAAYSPLSPPQLDLALLGVPAIGSNASRASRKRPEDPGKHPADQGPGAPPPSSCPSLLRRDRVFSHTAMPRTPPRARCLIPGSCPSAEATRALSRPIRRSDEREMRIQVAPCPHHSSHRSQPRTAQAFLRPPSPGSTAHHSGDRVRPGAHPRA